MPTLSYTCIFYEHVPTLSYTCIFYEYDPSLSYTCIFYDPTLSYTCFCLRFNFFKVCQIPGQKMMFVLNIITEHHFLPHVWSTKERQVRCLIKMFKKNLLFFSIIFCLFAKRAFDVKININFFERLNFVFFFVSKIRRLFLLRFLFKLLSHFMVTFMNRLSILYGIHTKVSVGEL